MAPDTDTTRTRAFSADWIWPAVLLLLATAAREPLLAFFESYDHPLNQIAFWLMRRLPFLPPLATHDAVMGLGFALLSLFVTVPAVVVFGKRSWVTVGLVFLWLNILWAIGVEQEVAESIGREAHNPWRLSVLSTYVANSIGAFIGAWVGARLALTAIRSTKLD